MRKLKDLAVAGLLFVAVLLVFVADRTLDVREANGRTILSLNDVPATEPALESVSELPVPTAPQQPANQQTTQRKSNDIQNPLQNNQQAPKPPKALPAIKNRTLQAKAKPVPSLPARKPVVVRKPPPPRKPEVKFFETKTQAKSVVFVCDKSSSMSSHGRFDRLCAELVTSVLALSPEQPFSVILFSSSSLPLTNPAGRTELMNATPDAKSRFSDWLLSQGASGGTNPEPGLQVAAGLKADVIYLLSDGQFSSLRESTFSELVGTVVHTIAFGDSSGATELKRIADRTGGTYRFVEDDVRFAQGLQQAQRMSEQQLLQYALKDDMPNRMIASMALIQRKIKDPAELAQFFADLEAERAAREAKEVELQMRWAALHETLSMTDVTDELVHELEQFERDAAGFPEFEELGKRELAAERKLLAFRDTAVTRNLREILEHFPETIAAQKAKSALGVTLLAESEALEAKIRRATSFSEKFEKELQEFSANTEFHPEIGEPVKKELEAYSKLSLAEKLLKVNPDAAKRRLQEVIDSYPGSVAAKKANGLILD